MVYVSVILLVALSILIGTIILRDALQGRVKILSARNVFLLGVLLFQSVSAAISLLAEDYGQVYLQSAGFTSLTFTLLLALFLLIFFYAYKRGFLVARLANRESVSHDATDAGLLICAFGAVAAGLVMRFALGSIPIFGILTIHLAAGCFAVATGLAGWAWGRRPANLAVIASAVLLLVVCVASLLAYSFGRREVLGVLLTFIWGLFYARWRFSGASLLIARSVIFGSIGFVFLAFFTATRRGDEIRSAGEYLSAFTEVTGAELAESVFALTNGQQAGSNSMWLIETRPNEYPYDTLHSLGYFVTHPIPRIVWETKYEALGRAMVSEARMTRMAEGYNVGPGIVGHIVNDNPWIALPVYAVLLGLAMRFIDQRVTRYIEDPFIVIPLGAGLAQILAMPRGEVGLFAFQLTASMIGGWIAVRVVGPLVWWRVEQAEPEIDEFSEGAEHDPFSAERTPGDEPGQIAFRADP